MNSNHQVRGSASGQKMVEYMPNLLVLQNEHANLVTSLPYIDEKIDEATKNQVGTLIQQEMTRMP